jgi:hypothetical protein
MFRKFRERTRQMQQELAEKRAANQLARQKLVVDCIIRAEKIKDPDLRKEAIEAAMRPLPPAPPASYPPSGPR